MGRYHTEKQSLKLSENRIINKYLLYDFLTIIHDCNTKLITIYLQLIIDLLYIKFKNSNAVEKLITKKALNESTRLRLF